MAEVKNNFLGAKMNRDIDDRLLPSNEYREAFNLQINRSEGQDVGTLQSVLGNSKVFDVNAVLPGITGLECIGSYADNSTNNIYIFLTNNSNVTYNKDANNYIYVYNSLDDIYTKLVQGAFLNFSILNPVLGINLIEDLLFWTDNRNQPRRINVKEASSSITYYTQEKQISVAKMNPLYPMELYRSSTLTGAPTGLAGYETSMLDVVSAKLPDGITNNPYIDSTYAGDPTYLEDKFIRFSYRYKFEDGEYSIMAPFTQIAYIPKQDGYFLYNSGASIDDETDTYRSTIVKFMRNKVNNIFLQIRLPSAANLLTSECKISYIEILYKDSNDLSVNAVDLIPVAPVLGGFFNTTATIYSYNYQSKKPFKTLPERDLIRVYDKTPIKAFGQEVVGNRVIYSNYQDKSFYPKYLNYNVGYGDKYVFGFTDGTGTSIKEYPNHSVKQNRNYQVGIILCDRFGRESGVILSDTTVQQENGTKFGGSSLYAPYLLPSDTVDVKPSYWPGNSLKILFNEIISPIEPDTVSGWPGIYEGNQTLASYNPLGWYSYKIVVKQTEQDYYNVYLPGTMASYPSNVSLEVGKTSHAVLINDNINKVPRDLTEVGPTQLQFRSSVILYPRVNNNNALWKNEMYYPGTSFSIVSTIADNNSLFFNATTPSTSGLYTNFYQISSNPLIARISTPAQLGVIPTTPTVNVINLSVFETKPFESKLDIYWETSSVGVISELNTAIQEGAAYSVKDMIGFTFSLSEADGNGSYASSDFRFTDIADVDINSAASPWNLYPVTVTLLDAKTQNNISVLDSFEIVTNGTINYRLKTKVGKFFYYGFTPEILNSYTFTIKMTVGSPEASKTFIKPGVLTNVAPTITTFPTSPIGKTSGDINVFTFAGNNGSNTDGGKSTTELTWSVTGSSQFTIEQTGLLKSIDAFANGTYNLVVKMTEASGLFVTKNVTVVYTAVNAVIITGPESETAPGVYYGTITVKGRDARIRAYAELYDEPYYFDPMSSIVFDCDGSSIEATCYNQGTFVDSLDYITLPGGTGLGITYDYGFTIEMRPTAGDVGICGFTWTQP